MRPDIEKVQGICRTPSISWGVLYLGNVIHRGSLGERDPVQHLEADCNTSYLLGSCAKMITSMALGIVAGQEKVSLEDPIRKHIPSFNPTEDHTIGEDANLVDALRHSTGLANPNAVFLGPEGTFANSGEDHIDMINALPTSNDSGQRFRKWWYYSNAAFGLIARVVEAVAGVDFSTFLQNEILQPLGMNHTFVTQEAVDKSDNIAHPYVQKSNGTWARINVGVTSAQHSATLASMGIRSSVNDLLTFCTAVLNQYDRDKGNESLQKIWNRDIGKVPSKNPLLQVLSLWDYWWTRPIDDGYDNDARHCLGWYRVTMPTAALGLTSYNFHRFSDPKSLKNFIIGKDAKPMIVYGHNGITNGSVATIYIIPEYHSAVVVLSNAADAGDASEITAQILLQALFNLKPHVDLVAYAEDSRDRCLKAHKDMIRDWNGSYEPSKCNLKPALDELLGVYLGLKTSRIHIISHESSKSGFAIQFADQEKSVCELEPYNVDALSFLPKEHDELLARGMIDWDFYKVGIIEFVRENEAAREGRVIGFRWQWDQYDYPGLWVKQHDEMSESDMDKVIEKHGRFLKDDKETETPA